MWSSLRFYWVSLSLQLVWFTTRNIILYSGARLSHFDWQPSFIVDAYAIFMYYKLALQLVVLEWDQGLRHLVLWVCTWIRNRIPREYRIRYAHLAWRFHLLDFFFVFLVLKLFMLADRFCDAWDTQNLVGRWYIWCFHIIWMLLNWWSNFYLNALVLVLGRSGAGDWRKSFSLVVLAAPETWEQHIILSSSGSSLGSSYQLFMRIHGAIDQV
jgi:hypothetical protein